MTRTAPSVSSQNASTAASSASAAAAPVLAREPPQERAGLRRVPPLPEEEDDAPRLAGLEVHRHLQRGAGVESGAEAAGAAAGRARPRARSEPLRPRNSSRSPVAERSGSLAAANATRRGSLAVEVARQDRAGSAVALGRDEALGRWRSAGRATIRCTRRA